MPFTTFLRRARTLCTGAVTAALLAAAPAADAAVRGGGGGASATNNDVTKLLDNGEGFVSTSAIKVIGILMIFGVITAVLTKSLRVVAAVLLAATACLWVASGSALDTLLNLVESLDT